MRLLHVLLVMTLLPLVRPAAADEPAPADLGVEAADTSRQFPDGRIVLAAHDATIEGTSARLERHPDDPRIGVWKNPADSVVWSWQPTRWGAYEARLASSTVSPSASEIEVTIGETTLAARLDPTAGPSRTSTLPLGRVEIPSTAPLKVRLRCTKPAEGSVVNLTAVLLEPACEGTPPRQAADGSILLHGRDATVRGTTLRWEPAERKQTLGFWTKPTDAAEWTFSIAAPGTFDLEVLQGCGTGQGGSDMAIDVDAGRPTASALTFTVEDTGGFQAFKPRIVGRVTLAEPGDHVLRVQPKKIAKAAACDIRQIRLVPVAR